MRSRLGALAGVTLVAAVALGAPAWAGVAQVTVGNFYFDDASPGDGVVQVALGDQARFVVMDGGPGTPHTVEIDELGVHSGALRSGETFTTPPLDRPGTFRLYCKPHDARGHVATLVVGDGAPTTAPPTTAAPPPAPVSTAAPEPTTTASPAKAPAPTTTPAPAKAPSPGPTTTAAPAGAASAPAPPPSTAEVPVPATSVAGAESAAGTTVPGAGLAPVGRGEATAGEMAAIPVPAGSLEGMLGRRPAAAGPWTRSVRMGLALLLPLALVGGGVAYRSSRLASRSGAAVAELRPLPAKPDRRAG